MKRAMVMIGVGMLLAGCASTGAKKTASPAVVSKASPAQQTELLDRVKTLEGTWEMTGPDGTKATLVFSTVAAGSAVREVMFPGTEHEMVNMYHMDGPTLVVTHYCAGGNQPRMRATAAEGDSIAFTCDSVTNLTAPDQGYMGGLTLVFVSQDRVTENWQHMQDGKVTNGPAFELTRKQ